MRQQLADGRSPVRVDGQPADMRKVKTAPKRSRTDISNMRRRAVGGISDSKSNGLSAGESSGLGAKETLP